ncbi:hypothetical protein HDN1F_35230 [gamma proteobacterium HdN1]|nr:Hypothetical protein HDN1F_17950 [gamma proteobacterium HdN1]CBL47106.1 hypothetical protein HDN1F_35230 [gamma proteobacterium HdN1]
MMWLAAWLGSFFVFNPTGRNTLPVGCVSPFFVSNKRRNTLKDLHERLRLSWLERAECYVATKVDQYVFLDRAITAFGTLPAGRSVWDYFLNGSVSLQVLWIFAGWVALKLAFLWKVSFYKHRLKAITLRLADERNAKQ